MLIDQLHCQSQYVVLVVLSQMVFLDLVYPMIYLNPYDLPMYLCLYAASVPDSVSLVMCYITFT